MLSGSAACRPLARGTEGWPWGDKLVDRWQGAAGLGNYASRQPDEATKTVPSCRSQPMNTLIPKLRQSLALSLEEAAEARAARSILKDSSEWPQSSAEPTFPQILWGSQSRASVDSIPTATTVLCCTGQQPAEE